MSTPLAFTQAFAITKSDTTNFALVGGRTICDAIYCASSGTLTVVFQDDSTCQFTAVAGGTIPVAAKRVNSTNTAQTTGMVALYKN